MEKIISYTVGDLKQLLQESKNEWKPKVGDGVKEKETAENEKSYNETEKKIKDFGGLKNPKKRKIHQNTDPNHSMLDVLTKAKPDKKYTDRVKAGLQGYNSTLEKNNKEMERVGEFDNEGALEAYFDEAQKRYKKNRETVHRMGLTSKELSAKDVEEHSLNETKKLKPIRLNFKHTTFINESQMLDRIPDEYKSEGQMIYMKDADSNEYIVECTKSQYTGNIETNVIGFNNQQVLNEQVSRIHELFGYKPDEAFSVSKPQKRINESQAFKEMMDLARNNNRK